MSTHLYVGNEERNETANKKLKANLIKIRTKTSISLFKTSHNRQFQTDSPRAGLKVDGTLGQYSCVALKVQ